MPEPIRNRFQGGLGDYDTGAYEAARTRPGFGPDEDPLAELARIVGETVPVAQPSGSRAASGIEARDVQRGADASPASPSREFARRDTSWRDPQVRTTVRASVNPQPSRAPVDDLEADLFNEIRAENIRSLPPAPDLPDLRPDDVRSPQYPVTSRGGTGAEPAVQARPVPVRPTLATPTVSGAGVSSSARAGSIGKDVDDEVTLPMHAVLRAAPPPARASEDLRMPQSPRFRSEPAPAPAVDAGYDSYFDDTRYHDPHPDTMRYADEYADPAADHDPAGAFRDGFAENTHGYPADAYQPDHDHEGYPSIHAHHDPDQEPEFGYEYDDGSLQPDYAPARRMRHASFRPAFSLKVGALWALGVVILGLGGVMTFRAVAGITSTGANAPLIKADVHPVKEMVDQQPAGADGPNLQAAADGQDKLVTHTEDPVDAIPGKPPVRIVGDGSPPTLAPVQRVHSVIVRPDGTLVNPDDANQRPAPAPPVRTAALDPSGTSSSTPQSAPQGAAQTSAASGSQPSPYIVQIDPTPSAPRPLPIVPVPYTNVAPRPPVPQQQAPAAAPQSQSSASQPAATPQPAIQRPAAARPVTPPSVAQAAPSKPVRPAGPPQPSLAPHPAADAGAPLALGPASSGSAGEGSPLPPLSSPPVHVASAATSNVVGTGDGGSGEWMVQISSHRSDDEARHALAAAEQKFASLGIKGGDVKQADLGARGTYFRVRLAGGTRDHANELCASIKAQGGDCVVAHR